MPEVSTLVRKQIIEYCSEHPGWSHSRIARELETDRPDLVDDLFISQRGYMLNQWVNRIVAMHRADQRNKLKSGEIIAAYHPDDGGRLYTVGEMTGTQVVELGNKYLVSGSHLTALGEFYIHIGGEAGRKKVKTVFPEAELRSIYERYTGGTK